MFQILLVVLKLSELNIISNEMVRDIMIQIHPYAQNLKDEWDVSMMISNFTPRFSHLNTFYM